MRIISGTARGTKLVTLEGEYTRPTLDRVKEPLFSILQNDIIDATVLDLFSGSGALALESLSRGAEKAVLCDGSKKAVRVIEENVTKTKMQEKAEVLLADYKVALKRLKEKGLVFDIVFLDPPYATDYDIQAIEFIQNENLLSDNGIIVVETDSDEKVEKIEKMNINILKIRKYGRVKLMFLNRKG